MQAWTGRRLAWQLARLLGPGRALALAERLAALGRAPRSNTAGVTRRGFLGKLGAAAFAFGLLANGKLALPAAARGGGTPAGSVPWWAVESLRQTPIEGAAKQALLGQALAAAETQAVRQPGPVLLSLTGTQAAEHVLADGRTLRALALGVGNDEVLVYYEDNTGQRAALLYRVVTQGDKPQLRLVAATDEALPTPAVRHSEILLANLHPAPHPVLRLLPVRLGQVPGLLWLDLLLCLWCRPILALRCMHLGSMPLVYIYLVSRWLVLYYVLRRARNMSEKGVSARVLALSRPEVEESLCTGQPSIGSSGWSCCSASSRFWQLGSSSGGALTRPVRVAGTGASSGASEAFSVSVTFSTRYALAPNRTWMIPT